MAFERVYFPGIKIIGIATKTQITEGQYYQDILSLWKRWATESLFDKIENRISNDTYNVFFDYDLENISEFSVLLGCAVENLNMIPRGMVGRQLPPTRCARYETTGKLPESLDRVWDKIESEKSYERNYIYDFNLYDSIPLDPEIQRVITMVSIK